MDLNNRPAFAIEINDEWESLVSQGLEAREAKDKCQWFLGSIASKVNTRYGTDALGKFAGEIGIPKNTLARYRDVFRGWQGKKTIPALSFNHHKVALGSADPELALQQAYENGWSCERLAHEIKHPQGALRPPQPNYCPHCNKWKLRSEYICHCMLDN